MKDLGKMTIDFVDNFDINSIPEDVRNSWIKSYTRAYLSGLDRDYENVEYVLQEFANMTKTPDDKIAIYPVREVINLLKEKYDFKDEQFYVTNFNNVSAFKIYDIPVFMTEPISVIVPNVYMNIAIIDEEIKNCGYYKIRMSKKKDNAGKEWYVLGYNPIRQDNIRKMIEGFRWLHLSPTFNRKEIYETGLVLSSCNDNLHIKKIEYSCSSREILIFLKEMRKLCSQKRETSKRNIQTGTEHSTFTQWIVSKSL